jgi:hypothetical protein
VSAPQGRRTRAILLHNAEVSLHDARNAAAAVVEELAKDGGGEADVIDGHLLDLRWALGERRGVLNALSDLEDEELVPEGEG